MLILLYLLNIDQTLINLLQVSFILLPVMLNTQHCESFE